jgi:hypothetical protein
MQQSHGFKTMAGGGIEPPTRGFSDYCLGIFVLFYGKLLVCSQITRLLKELNEN